MKPKQRLVNKNKNYNQTETNAFFILFFVVDPVNNETIALQLSCFNPNARVVVPLLSTQ